MILSVTMTNWRAYDERLIEFKPGVNFLMGANGKGKTSVLEAIAFALIGEASTVTDPDRLERKSGVPMQVELKFEVKGTIYVLTRTRDSAQKRSTTVRLVQEGQRKALATTAKSAQAEIEKLMGVSVDFLQRIIYMAEGDVFRFLDTPPGDAINRQIRQVLGLTQMDEFLSAMNVAEKNLNARIKELTALLKDLDKAGIRNNDAFQLQMADVGKRKNNLTDALTRLERERAIIEAEHSPRHDVRPALALVLSHLSGHPQASRLPVSAAQEFLEDELQRTRATLHTTALQRAHRSGEKAASDRILNLLLPMVGHTETLPCPVCHKPMTSAERDTLLHTIQKEIERLDAEIDNLTGQGALAEKDVATLEAGLASLTQLRNEFAASRAQLSILDVPLIELSNKVESYWAERQQQFAQLDHDRQVYRQAIDALEQENLALLALRGRLSTFGYASPAEASEALVGLETRALSLRAAQGAAQEALTTQQNSDLVAVFKQVASAWAGFLGDDQWSVSFDVEGNPVLRNKEGREFDLSQFSGGEKTAMLIMLHTIMAHYFSSSDFLMIDEPLEHLDPINRRSLIYFLLAAYKHGAYRQAIIATFEEALLRKYMSDDHVTIVYI